MTDKANVNPSYQIRTQLRGHQEALQVLASAYDENRLHHGWIIAGPYGVGKFRLACQIACWLLSQSLPAQDTGLFAQTQEEDVQKPISDISAKEHMHTQEGRLVVSGAHPDLLLIQAESDDKNKSGQIKTEQIRKLSHFFGHTATRKGWRVAIIDSLDLVNRNGLNAMLKILEEPPAYCLILLLSSRPGQILPTIKSRVTRLDLSPLPHDICCDVLAEIWPEKEANERAELSYLAQGSPGRAVSLCESGALSLFEEFCHVIGKKDTQLSALSELAEKWGTVGMKSYEGKQATKYLFDVFLSSASLQAARSLQAKHTPLQQLEECGQAISRISHIHDCAHIARLHQEFLADLVRGEALYIDFVPTLVKFFFDMHGQKSPLYASS